MKIWRNVGILGFLLLALGGIASWDEWQTKKDKEAENSKNRLTLLQPDEIYELRILTSHTKGHAPDTTEPQGDSQLATGSPVDVRMVKKNGQWQIVSPIDYPADKSTIDAVIKTITDYAYTQEIPVTKEKWVDFGLDHPQQVVTLQSTSKPTQGLTIFLGSKAPIGYNVYLRTSASEKVFMGSQHLLVSTNKSFFDFRDKRILNLEENATTSIRYEQGGQPIIEVVKSGDAYAMTLPEPADVDEAEVKDFIAELNSLKAEGIEDKPEGDLLAALQKPEFQITWTGTIEGAKALRFATFRDQLYASLDPNVSAFALSNEARQKLKREAISFRNRRILSTDLLNVKTIEIDGNLYENHNGSWYSTAQLTKLKEPTPSNPKEQPKEEAHVRALMVDLEFTKTDKFYSSKAEEVASHLEAAPVHRLKISYNETGKAPLLIELFATNDKDKYLVRRSDKPTIYRVPRSSFYSVSPSAPGPEGKFSPPTTNDDLPVDDSDDPSLNISSPSAPQPG